MRSLLIACLILISSNSFSQLISGGAKNEGRVVISEMPFVLAGTIDGWAKYELAIDRWKAAIILNAAAEAPWSGLIFSLMRDGRHEGARAALAEARRRVENEAVLMASSHIQQLQTEEPTGGAT